MDTIGRRAWPRRFCWRSTRYASLACHQMTPYSANIPTRGASTNASRTSWCYLCVLTVTLAFRSWVASVVMGWPTGTDGPFEIVPCHQETAQSVRLPSILVLSCFLGLSLSAQHSASTHDPNVVGRAARAGMVRCLVGITILWSAGITWTTSHQLRGTMLGRRGLQNHICNHVLCSCDSSGEPTYDKPGIV